MTVHRAALATVPSRIGSRLLSVRGARPCGVVSGEQLGAPFGKSAAWVEQRTGIQQLHRVGADESILGVAVDAARRAVLAAGVDIDLVLVATCSALPTGSEPDPMAGLTDLVAPNTPTVRMNVACSGFTYALAAADSMIRTGQAEHVLVVAVEHMSRFIDPDDLGTSIVFGDGAGAAVIGPADHTGIGPVVWGSDGGQSAMIECSIGPSATLRMNGQGVFRWAVEIVPRLAAEACRRAGVLLSDVDVFAPHQANLRIIDAAARTLGLQDKIVADDVRLTGNTSAASVPLALSALLERGVAKAGQLALLVGFGAGLSYAAQVVELP